MGKRSAEILSTMGLGAGMEQDFSHYSLRRITSHLLTSMLTTTMQSSCTLSSWSCLLQGVSGALASVMLKAFASRPPASRNLQPCSLPFARTLVLFHSVFCGCVFQLWVGVFSLYCGASVLMALHLQPLSMLLWWVLMESNYYWCVNFTCFPSFSLPSVVTFITFRSPVTCTHRA